MLPGGSALRAHPRAPRMSARETRTLIPPRNLNSNLREV